MFRDTVLKIEGDEISAFEVSHHLEILKGHISLRKEEKFLDSKTEEEMNVHEETGAFDKEEIWGFFNKFYGIYTWY